MSAVMEAEDAVVGILAVGVTTVDAVVAEAVIADRHSPFQSQGPKLWNSGGRQDSAIPLSSNPDSESVNVKGFYVRAIPENCITQWRSGCI